MSNISDLNEKVSAALSGELDGSGGASGQVFPWMTVASGAKRKPSSGNSSQPAFMSWQGSDKTRSTNDLVSFFANRAPSTTTSKLPVLKSGNSGSVPAPQVDLSASFNAGAPLSVQAYDTTTGQWVEVANNRGGAVEGTVNGNLSNVQVRVYRGDTKEYFYSNTDSCQVKNNADGTVTFAFEDGTDGDFNDAVVTLRGVNDVTTQSTGSTTLQAEDGVMSGGVRTAFEHAGAEGGAFADYLSTDNASITWTVDSAGGEAPLTIRYALADQNRSYNGEGNSRTMEVFVNDVSAGTVTFTPTGDSWTDWGDVTIDIQLDAGQNSIELRAIGESGPNIDSITVGDAPGGPTEHEIIYDTLFGGFNHDRSVREMLFGTSNVAELVETTAGGDLEVIRDNLYDNSDVAELVETTAGGDVEVIRNNLYDNSDVAELVETGAGGDVATIRDNLFEESEVTELVETAPDGDVATIRSNLYEGSTVAKLVETGPDGDVATIRDNLYEGSDVAELVETGPDGDVATVRENLFEESEVAELVEGESLELTKEAVFEGSGVAKLVEGESLELTKEAVFGGDVAELVETLPEGAVATVKEAVFDGDVAELVETLPEGDVATVREGLYEESEVAELSETLPEGDVETVKTAVFEAPGKGNSSNENKQGGKPDDKKVEGADLS